MTTRTTPDIAPTPNEVPDPPGERWLTSLTDVITVTAWRDPLVDVAPGSIPTASDEALVWFTPIIGPTSVLMAHRWATYSADAPSTWAVDDIARTFGLGESVSRVMQTIFRLERFGIVRRRDFTVSVRLMLAPLSQSQRSRLPRYLAEVYPG
jgi:hypothetical protein